MNRTIADVDKIVERIQANDQWHTITAHLVTDDQIEEWADISAMYPRLAKKYEGAYMVIGNAEIVRVLFFYGHVPYLNKTLHIPSDSPQRKLSRAVRYHSRKR